MANWTREQLLVALNLYCQLDFGKFHERNPLIIETAKHLNRSAGALAMKLCNFASLDPAITASGRKGLQGASALDKEIWTEFQQTPDALAEAGQDILDSYAQHDKSLAALASNPTPAETSPDFFADNATALVKVRRKQNFFRKAILSSYESRCCMSGIRHPQLLVASHIVPWAKDEHNRLNPANGLCLSALHDRAFDEGLITVTPDFFIHVSDALRDTETARLALDHLLALDKTPITAPHKFAPQADFLKYHNDNIFKG